MDSRSDRPRSLPSAKAVELIKLIKRWNVSDTKLLEGLNLTKEDLENPDFRFSYATLGELVERACALTGEPGLGIYMGLHRRATISSTVVITAAYARTLREGIELLVRAAPSITAAVTYQLKIEGGVARLIMDGDPDLGRALEYVYFSLMIGLWSISTALTRKNLHEAFDLTIPEPVYFSRFSWLLPNTRFDQPVTQIAFDASFLELPLSAPDTEMVKAIRAQAERDLLELGFGPALVERVRNLLPKPRGFRSLNEVAAVLHLSPRTLKRQLAEKRVSFSELLERQRYEKALILLNSSNNSLEEVTERIGYSTVPNFVRAFRRWTGNTPAAYRRVAHNGLSKG